MPHVLCFVTFTSYVTDNSEQTGVFDTCTSTCIIELVKEQRGTVVQTCNHTQLQSLAVKCFQL